MKTQVLSFKISRLIEQDILESFHILDLTQKNIFLG
jgi:hypothetical protein